MSVRHSLLAILMVGDAYGYQLRQEFNRRTDDAWPLNVGQVYTTLDRLERDGLVTQAGADGEGHIVYAITSAGTTEVHHWLSGPVLRTERDELAVKIAIAQSLPGVDFTAIIDAQRAAVTSADDGVIGAWRAAVAEAEAKWLDVVATHARAPYGLAGEAPKRGRPARL